MILTWDQIFCVLVEEREVCLAKHLSLDARFSLPRMRRYSSPPTEVIVFVEIFVFWDSKKVNLSTKRHPIVDGSEIRRSPVEVGSLSQYS